MIRHSTIAAMGAIISVAVLIAAQNACADRYALLVGNSSAQGKYEELKYVRNDMTALKDILTDFCGFDKAHIVTLYNGTPEDIDRFLKTFAEQMAAGGGSNMFLFYYSGHADQACLRMGGLEYRLDTLKKKLTDFPSDIRVGVFDACQSGSFTRIKGGKLDEPFLFRDDGKTKGQVILCSSSTNENAQESDALGNSIFTFHIVNALRGSGDLSGDGRVTLSEAYQYAYNHTLSSTAGSAGGVQHPSYQFRIQGEGDIVLADLNVSSRGIVLGPDVIGAVTILSASNVVVADLNKEKNSGVMIALSPGVYSVINGRGEDRYQAMVTVAERKIVKVQKSDFVPVKSDAGRKKGGGQKGFEFGIAVGGRGGRYDFSDAEAALDGRFAGFHRFSIDPRFTMEKNLGTLQLTFELVYDGHHEGHLGFGTWDNSLTQDYSGTEQDFSGSSYHVGLHVEKTIRINTVDLGTGYCFTDYFVKNFNVFAGLAFFTIDLKVSSIFTDSLFDAVSRGSGLVHGTLIVPYAGLGYEWPLTGWLGVGSNIRYRYQKTAEKIDDINFNFGGVDGNVFVRLHFTAHLWELLL